MIRGRFTEKVSGPFVDVEWFGQLNSIPDSSPQQMEQTANGFNE
jgi:hypothetical protein